MTASIRHTMNALRATIVMLLFHSFSNAQDTLFVNFSKTVKGCPIQGPMLKDTLYFIHPQPTYPVYTYLCGHVPDLVLDSIPGFGDHYSGIVMARYYWKTDTYSDSLYKKAIIEIRDGKTVSKKSYSYRYYQLIGESVETDTAKTETFYHNGQLEEKRIFYYLASKPYSHDPSSQPCTAEEYFYSDDDFPPTRVFYCGESVYEELYQKVSYEYEEYFVQFVLKDNVLIDLFNVKPLFVNRRGKIISKADFMSGLQTGKVKGWEYSSLPPEERMECVNCLVTETGFDRWDEKEMERLKKKMRDECR